MSHIQSLDNAGKVRVITLHNTSKLVSAGMNYWRALQVAKEYASRMYAIEWCINDVQNDVSKKGGFDLMIGKFLEVELKNMVSGKFITRRFMV